MNPNESSMNRYAIKPAAIVGQTLTNLLQTTWSAPVCHIEGVGDAIYCSVVLDFNGVRFALNYDSIKVWQDSEPLQLLNLEEHGMAASASPIGSSVLSVAVDQLEDLYVLLSNGVYLHFDVDNGSRLQVFDTADLRSDTIGDSPLVLTDWWSGQLI